jgi:hypothetical protein
VYVCMYVCMYMGEGGGRRSYVCVSAFLCVREGEIVNVFAICV